MSRSQQEVPDTPEHSYNVCHGAPFVFQDNVSSQDELSEYQAGSEASSSVRRILSPAERRAQGSEHYSMASSLQSGISAPSQIHTRQYIPFDVPPPSQPSSNSRTDADNKQGRPFQNRTNTMQTPTRRQSRGHVPYTPGDVSSITSGSMTSAYSSGSSAFYTSQSSSAASKSTPMSSHNNHSSLQNYLTKRNDKKKYKPLPPPRGRRFRKDHGDAASDTEISNLTTSSESSASSGGFLGKLLRPPGTKKSKRPSHHSSKKKKAPRKHLPTEDDDTMTSPSWALSPISPISSIPEEDERGGGGQLSRSSSAHSLHSQSPSRLAHDSNLNKSQDHPQTMSPPQSGKSLNSQMDVSLAMSSSVVSYQSEETPVIRNTGGDGDIEAGSVQSPQSFRSHRPTLPTIPSNGLSWALTDADASISSSSSSGDTSLSHQQHPKRRSRAFCRGKQGAVICCLICLFIFGLVTVIVSIFMSRREGDRDSVGMIQGDAQQDDDIFLDDSEADILFPNNTNTPNSGQLFTSAAPTVSPTQAQDDTNVRPDTNPPVVPSDDDALFANVMEDLLNSLTPSVGPTTEPTSSPTASPTVAIAQTGAPGIVDSVNPTLRPSSSPSSQPTIEPTSSPSASTTSAAPSLSPSALPSSTPSTSPTTLEPLLTPETILNEEAQLWGLKPGDTAGYSVALSGNGQILVVGAPNAAASSSDLTRAGQVRIYERQAGSTSTTATSRQDISSDWILRGTSLMEGTESMGQFGYSVATSDNGRVVVMSSPTADSRRGRVYIYEWEDSIGEYIERQILSGAQTTDHFGISISLSADGRRLAVGAPYHSTQATGNSPAANLRGQVVLYEYSETAQEWESMQTATPDLLQGSASLDWFGWSLDLDGQILCVGAPRNTEFGGYVQCFQFDQDEGVWKLMGLPIINTIAPVKLDDRFGHAVSVTTSGTRANDAGTKLIRVAIGAPSKDVGDVLNSGLVAVYEWSESQSAWLVESDRARIGASLAEEEPGFYHQFGYSLQMEGDVLAIGVPGWDNQRGLVDLFWLGHAFSNNNADASSSTWQKLNEPVHGVEEGEDFGYSVSFALPLPEGSDRPSSLLLSSGAIMVSDSTQEEYTGYAKVFQTGRE